MGLIKGAIGAATFGVAGAMAGNVGGALLAGNTPGSNIEEGAFAGGVAGGVIGGAVGVMATHPMKSAEAVGAVGLGIAQFGGGIALGTAEIVGGAAIKAAPAVASGAMSLGGMAISKYGSQLAGIGSKLVRPLKDAETPNLLGHKASALGIGMYAGSKMIGGIKEGFDSFNRNRMGSIDTNVRRATPRTPSYAQNAGATGDLVFAMNRNRRG